MSTVTEPSKKKEMAHIKVDERGQVTKVPPDRHKFEEDVAKVTQLINEKEKLIESSSGDYKDLSDQLMATGIKLERAEEERTKIVSEIKSTDETIHRIGGEIGKQRDQANRLIIGLRYKTEDLYEEQIMKLESQLQGSHFSIMDRRKLHQEVENLKEAKTKLKDYLASREAMDNYRTEQDDLRKRKDSLHYKNRTQRETITALRDKMELLRKQIEERKNQQREKKIRQDVLAQEISALYRERKRLNDDFRQRQAEYLVEYHKTVQDTAIQVSAERLQERKAARDKQFLKPNTQKEVLFEEEKTMCHTLMSYLSRLSGNSPLLCRIGSSSSSPINPSPENTPLVLPRPLASSTAATYQVMRKGDEEEEWLPMGGHRDRKDRRKIKKERRKSFSGSKGHSHKPLHHNPTIFEQFSRIGLHPPMTSAEIPQILDQLKEKLAQYDVLRHEADSEAGDSGIMSSTGISEFSDTGMGDPDITSGEVTPNKLHMQEERSLSPISHDSTDTVVPLADHNPVDSDLKHNDLDPDLEIVDPKNNISVNNDVHKVIAIT